ncbi:hypothetical protein ABN057_20670 [Providencia alcalifaciens]|uniref:hypothetical protein n=1 Tax=Providencia TaxID=586 RepID=UPI000BCBDA84|nr:hypothetical protein [Providencia sp. PROV157]EGT3589447.1 hypothetical protein [Proteus mirabilis]MBV2187675.1 hypothetical protein [Providencia rettgeri]PCQ37979.1 hypothetical protein CQA26_11580 [Providencia rettgeri]HEM8137459.1 hypothetical protein [Providencia rettgeri]
MITLGIRAEPKQISFVVYCSDENKLLCVDKVTVPQALDTPEQLKYIRNNILDVLREYKVERAALRVAEGIAKNKSLPRYYLEAVIQEAFSSSNLSAFSIMRSSTIIKDLKINKKQYDQILDSSQKIKDIDNSKFKKATNEALMVAIAVASHD